MFQDWHPQNQISFFSNLDDAKLDPDWKKKNQGTIKMFDQVVFKGDPPVEQVLSFITNTIFIEAH